MNCPLCKQPLGVDETLTFELEEVEDGSQQLHIHHNKNGHWCWCYGLVD